ncbi:hypothetical protein BDQ17DRAFT_1428391 [Cyathus striatus]|nr:hypothetical protein BDQ17DRAFT_1428391 [Cyathus striatus]
MLLAIHLFTLSEMRLSWKRYLVQAIVICIVLAVAGQFYNFWNLTELSHLYGPPADSIFVNERSYMPAPSWIPSIFDFPENSRDYRDWNKRELLDLRACIALDNCGINQDKVALLATATFEMGVIMGDKGGESVWGLSMYRALKELGYTVFFSSEMGEGIIYSDAKLNLSNMFRGYTPAVSDHARFGTVVLDNSGICHLDPTCVKSDSNPDGIPAWKIFEFTYWPVHYHREPNWSMMGGEWILTSHPDDMYYEEPSPIQYIGFSIEDSCPEAPVPLEEREPRIYMHMKYLRYLSDDKWSWDVSWFTEVAEELNATFIGGWINDNNAPEVGNARITNLGRLSHEQFIEELAKSRVMLSMGNPYWSPSAWQALCLGVPIVQPIMGWDKNDPWNRKKWDLQHPSLSRYDPPYVYHVHAKNYSGFLEAMRAAYTTPIEGFVPSFMTEEAVKGRVDKLMKTDWRYRGAELLVQRVAANNGSYIFQL